MIVLEDTMRVEDARLNDTQITSASAKQKHKEAVLGDIRNLI